MSRPKRYSKEVIEATAIKLLPLVLKWLNDEQDNGELLVSIIKAIECNDDGFDIATSLHDIDDLEPDAELVRILDDTSHIKSQCQKELCIKWIAEKGIKPLHGTGDTVMYQGDKSVIKKITEDGQYLLFIASKGHVESGTGTHGIYVNWEDVNYEAE